MFRFSFHKSNEEDSCKDREEHSPSDNENINWLPCEKVEVVPSHLNYMLSHQNEELCMRIGSLLLRHLSTEAVMKAVTSKPNENSKVKIAEDLHSDLVPSKYEGGLKIWECTEDLLEWLVSERPDTDLCGKRVLDLGCGAGLLGIAALKAGACVTFQDYNKEVLDACTIPNVLLNMTDEEAQKLIESQEKLTPQCEFYSGDWLSFLDKYQEGRKGSLKFDYILTSETIYNPENYKKLCKVFQECLKKSGCIYVAAKTYYFGVGGSLRQFEKILQDEGIMKPEVCWRCSSGVSREIMKVSFIDGNE